MLRLLRVERYTSYELYVFNINNEIVKLTYSQAISLIAMTHSKRRNCKIVNGKIQLKPNEGRLETVVVKAPIKRNKKGLVKIDSKLSADKMNIFSNNWYFRKTTVKDINFIETCGDIIKSIDNATIVGSEEDKIMITKFGRTKDLSNLSTGCKTLLNILHLIEKGDKSKTYYVNIDECGENVIPMVFNNIAETNIVACLHHSMILGNTGHTFEVNGTRVSSWIDVIDHI